MNRIIAALLVSLLLSGCSAEVVVPHASSQLAAEASQAVPAAASTTEAPYKSSAQASGVEDDIPFIYVPGDFAPGVSVSAVDLGFEQSQIQEELSEIAARSTAFLAGMRHIESNFETIFILSQDEKHELLRLIGQMGYVAADSRMDMCNSEQINAFYRAYEEKSAAQVGIYTFDGQIMRTTFLCRNGIVYRAFSHIRWMPDLEPEIDPIESFYKTEVFTMSDKGYLFYGNNEKSDGKKRAVSGLRVEPLGEENRRLCREYIDPLNSYASTALFSTDWDSANLELLHLNDVFEFLYQKETGLSADDVFTESFRRDSVYPKAVPALEFEAIITRYFPVSAKQLREIAVYDADRQVYAFESLMHPDASPDWEVVGSTKNEDGSLTIIVDGVRPENLMDRTVSNTVVIMPGGDGSFQYMSNRLTRFYDEADQYDFTPFQDYRPRVN